MDEERRKPGRPKMTNSDAQNEIERVKEQFDTFDEKIKDMTMDRMNAAPKQEVEPQTKLSDKQIDKFPDHYLKPVKKISDRQVFNEDFRSEWNFQKEYVNFIAEHKECIGENIEIWTHPFGGVGAEYWEVPTNKPVWGPRYLAEQIKKKAYHRLTMQQNVMTSSGYGGQMYGALTVDTTIQRLDATPVSKRRSVFMGANSF